MPKILFPLFAFLLLFPAAPLPAETDGNSFRLEEVAPGVHAALARPGGHATTNAFFVETERYVLVAGAHLAPRALDDLVAAVASVTAKPVRYFILTHHHRGFSFLDFDFPPDREVIMSWQTWKALSGEKREIAYPALFFQEGMTLKLDGRTVILSNVGRGHTEGDIAVFLPEAGILFASDLVYHGSAGYMGEGHMQEWVLALELMESMRPAKIVPGLGPVGTVRDLAAFKTFFKDFLTAVLRHIEAGDTLETTLRTFSLPAHEELDGYRQFLKVNLERAYRDLQENFRPN